MEQWIQEVFLGISLGVFGHPLLISLLFSVLTLIIPVSILTVSLATVFAPPEGILIIVIGYLLGIIALIGLLDKFLDKVVDRIPVTRYLESGIVKKGANIPSIILASMSVPFVPLITLLKISKIPNKTILLGVYLGGLPMMLITYTIVRAGTQVVPLGEFRYLAGLILVVYGVYLSVTKIFVKNKEEEVNGIEGK